MQFIVRRFGVVALSLWVSSLVGGCSAQIPPKLASTAQGTMESKAGQDWPAFLGPQGDGTSKETGIAPKLWKPHPPLKWTIPLGTSYGGPTIVGNKLLQFDRHGDQERLTCYHTVDGRELWRAENPVEYVDNYGYNDGPRCSPIVSDELVYTYGVAGQLTCYALDTGDVKWTKNLVDEYTVVQNFFGVASTPYIYKDLLLVMVGGSPRESLRLPARRLDEVQPNGTAVVAFDKASGQERYRLGDDLASYASMTVRSIEGKPTGLAFLRSGLLAFDPDSGEKLFDFPWRASMLESVNAALPVTHKNQILISETYEIGSVLLEVEQGKPQVVWKDQGTYRDLSFRAHWATPVLVDGYLFGCSGRNRPDSDFRCVRFSDGAVQWMDRRRERSSVLFVDGYLIVLGEHGTLELIKPNSEKLEVVAQADLSSILDPSDGTPLLDYPCWAAPVLAHGTLYLRGASKLVAFNLIPKQQPE